MKKILLCIFCVISIASCGLNSKDSNKSSEPSIVGNWETNITDNDKNFDLYFDINQDGSARMWGKSGDGQAQNIENIKWSKKDM